MGGKEKEDGPYQLLSEAVAEGLLHVNCQHNLNTFYPGILSCQHICYTYEKVFQNTCYFIENYKWISQGVKLRVP